MGNVMAALPEFILALAAMALLMYGAFAGDGATRRISYLSIIVLAVAAVALSARGGAFAVLFGGQFVVDQFGLFMKWLVLIGAGIAIWMAVGFNEREGIARFEYPILILFATLGMLMMVSANNLMALYVGLELQSLALYVIAAFRRDSARSSEAGLKYFVLGALASGMMLYGISLIYGFAGSTSFETLARVFETFGGQAPPLGVVVGLVFLMAGLAFKVAAVPFHMWTPDVYEGAPTPVTAFFSLSPKIAALALFVRVMLGPFAELWPQWQQIVIAISIASMLLGSLAAIRQTNIKRLMAYSSIGHIGYMLIGLAAGTDAGVRGIAIYLAIYLAMNAGTFACILYMRRYGRMVENIDDLAGLSRTNPGLAAAFAIFMFSMAGIPPLAGFFGKLYVFLAAVDAGLYVLAIIGVLASVVGAYYYLRIVKLMYFDEPAEPFERNVATELRPVLILTGLFTLLFFIWPGPVLDGAAAAAAALFAG